MEVGRKESLHLFGRHFVVGSHRKKCRQAPQGNHPRPAEGGPENKSGQVHLDTHPTGEAFGSVDQPQRGAVRNTHREVEGAKEGNRENCRGKEHVVQKNEFHFGTNQKLPGSHAFSPHFDRSVMSNGEPAHPVGVGPLPHHLRGGQNPGQRTQKFSRPGGWQKFSNTPQKEFVVRQQHPCLGGAGQPFGSKGERFLEAAKRAAHQRKRAQSSRGNHQVPGEKRAVHSFACRQSSSLQLSVQVGRKKGVSQSGAKTPSLLVSRKENLSSGQLGTHPGAESRHAHKGGARSGGLHPQPRSVSKGAGLLQERHQACGGHVLHPQQQKIPKVLLQVSTPRGNVGECIANQSGGTPPSLCKSTLEHHSTVGQSSHAAPCPEMSDGGALLGFNIMVAPINVHPAARNKGVAHSAQVGLVHKLLGGGNAPPKWNLACMVVSGSCYRSNKFKMKASRLI